MNETIDGHTYECRFEENPYGGLYLKVYHQGREIASPYRLGRHFLTRILLRRAANKKINQHYMRYYAPEEMVRSKYKNYKVIIPSESGDSQ